ncbi:uncharacterized protein V6R79_017593 [Siganus canaliculatus]
MLLLLLLLLLWLLFWLRVRLSGINCATVFADCNAPQFHSNDDQVQPPVDTQSLKKDRNSVILPDYDVSCEKPEGFGVSRGCSMKKAFIKGPL